MVRTQSSRVTPLLQTRDLSKHFGGIYATHAVNLEVLAGETHAVIGPNGAGKTTLVAQLSGGMKPDRGRIEFDGSEITTLSMHERVARGLVRSYQIASIFPNFTVRDNLLFAVQARTGSSFSFLRPIEQERDIYAQANAVLTDIALTDHADKRAMALAHGQRRQLELGLAIATKPKLLLLDEPMAGMGVEESKQMLDLLAKLKPRFSLLLIEHDMDTVFKLADRISVLVAGQLIATGKPEEIRRNAEVRAAYLGEDA